MTPARYTFGDGDVAAERLALVAAVFEPTSQRLMASVPAGAVRLGLADAAGVVRLAEGLAAVRAGTVRWVLRQVVLAA